MIDFSGKTQERLDPETIETYLRQDDVSLAILVYGAEYSKNLSARNNITMREIVVPIRDRLKKGYTLEQIAKELVPDSQNDSDAGANDKPSLTTISAVDLQKKDLSPIRWIVNDLIPAGLSILASPPKYGKSWLMLALCLAVAFGYRFLGYQTNRTGALYLALEDSQRRLKSRMNKLLDGQQAPDGFFFSTTANDLDNGLLDELDGFLTSHPDTGLIVIDTFQKVRGVAHDREGSYAADYRETANLKAFADSHNVALVVIHHLRKMKDDGDPFNMISGTNGIMGAADTSFVLAKENRDADTATLYATGRDIEGGDMVLSFNKNSCKWENLGNVDIFMERQARQEYQNSPIVLTVKKLLEQSPDGWEGTAKQLLDAGTYITHTRLADSARGLTDKLKGLDTSLFEIDGILHNRKPNGSGGGKHKFYYADSQQIEEIEPLEYDPFEEV